MVFFALPIVPSDFVITTRVQKAQEAGFCKHYSCGLSFIITPYQFTKQSLNNFFK